MPLLTDAPLSLRRPSLADAQAVTDLINAADLVDYGESDLTLDDMLEEFEGSDLERDAWLVERDGRLVGVGALQNRAGVRLSATVYVHPDDRRRGIGTALTALLEERGRELIASAPADAQVSIVGWLNGEAPEPLAWARGLGYERVRSFQRMRIDMTDAPPEPHWPKGITLRTYRPGMDDRSLFDAVEEAFSDHWGHLPMQFDEWLRRTQRDDFDPSLWFIAMDGEQIAAMSLCSLMIDDGGWVSSLAVRRPWRQRGLARAILLHSFGELWRRDRRWVALGVDADSLTGATRLYRSVGMYVREAHEQVRKILREGAEVEVRSLD